MSDTELTEVVESKVSVAKAGALSANVYVTDESVYLGRPSSEPQGRPEATAPRDELIAVARALNKGPEHTVSIAVVGDIRIKSQGNFSPKHLRLERIPGPPYSQNVKLESLEAARDLVDGE